MQVFDSGLIGEGVLHMLAAAKQKLLTKDATLVPAAATVFCQPLQMRIGQASTISSLSPLVLPLLSFLFAHPSLPIPLCLSLSALPSLPFPLCLSLSAFPLHWSLSCWYCQAMHMQSSCRRQNNSSSAQSSQHACSLFCKCICKQTPTAALVAATIARHVTCNTNTVAAVAGLTIACVKIMRKYHCCW